MRLTKTCCVSLLLSLPILAQSTQPTAAGPAPEETRVIDAYNLLYKNDAGHLYHASVGIGEIVELRIRNLKSLDTRASCRDDSGKAVPDCKTQDIALFLDGRVIKGMAPESKVIEGKDGTLQFHLARNENNDETWADLLGRPAIGGAFFRRHTGVSAGLVDGFPVPSDVDAGKFSLTRIRPKRFWVCSGLLLLLLGLVVYKSQKGNLIRDPWPDDAPKLAPRPYSLARFQIVFWFCLIITSFLYIWQITGNSEIITAGVLALMGIGSGTVLGAAVIDSNKRSEKGSRLKDLEAGMPILDQAISELETRIKGAQIPSEIESLNREKADQIKARALAADELKDLRGMNKPPKSEGFLADILSDANGISIHRLQMFAWTGVLGLMFVGSVWARLSMPEFSTTLLAMQGLSAGTYLGFKIPEKQA